MFEVEIIETQTFVLFGSEMPKETEKFEWYVWRQLDLIEVELIPVFEWTQKVMNIGWSLIYLKSVYQLG